jgi:hypothetical protein
MIKIVSQDLLRHPARRIFGKHIPSLIGETLLHNYIRSMLSCPDLDQEIIVIETQPVAEGFQQHFPIVHTISKCTHEGQPPILEDSLAC